MLNNITYSPNLNNNSLFEGKEFASRVNYKKVMGNGTNFTGAFKSNNDDKQTIWGKKSDDDLVIELDRNKDIAQEIGKIKNNKILVGFAAETNDLIENASLKIKKKNLDFIVANDLTKEGAGFGVDTNIVKIIDKEGNITEYPKMKKEEVANIILDKIKELLSV